MTQPRELSSLVDLDDVQPRLAEALARCCDLLRQAPDPGAPVPGLTWNVGELGAHLVTGAQLWNRMLHGEPSPIAALTDAPAHTSRLIAGLDERDPRRLAGLVEQEIETIAVLLARQPPDRPLPWHAGLRLTAAQMAAVGLGELLVHGLDLARVLDRRWPISDDDARTVIYGVAPVLPALVDHGRAGAVRIRCELRLRGGTPLAVDVADGTLDVAVGPDPGATCRISARATPFLLVAYGRARPWGFAARGQLVAWGRRPWRAVRLPSLLMSL